MKSMILAAVAAVTLGMTGAALADAPIRHSLAGAQTAGNSVVLPSQRPSYLARNESVDPQQRPAYLAGNSVVLPSQRPAYLASNSVVLPSQRPSYLA